MKAAAAILGLMTVLLAMARTKRDARMYNECVKAGHSKLYCVTTINR